ncbi:MAG: FmdE family protein [Desulfonatronovibrio sp.]
MHCAVDKETVKEIILFHGHNCPGLSIGIRASELALDTLKRQKGDNILAVVETDMCAVDAIQFLTGCTLGKGNLIHRDFGKTAFSFFDPDRKKAIRLTLKPGCFGSERDEMRSLMQKDRPLSAGEKQRLEQLRQKQIQDIMEMDQESLFEVADIDPVPPRSARIMDSLECAYCREMTMESRVRLYAGKIYCIPCFEKVDQKR